MFRQVFVLRVILLLLISLVLFSEKEGLSEAESDTLASPLLRDLSSLLESLEKDPVSFDQASEWFDSEARRLQSESERLEKLLENLYSDLEILKAKSRLYESKRLDPDSLPSKVKSILAENCFACHGPDASQRKAGLRLDDGLQIFEEQDSGVPLITPGDPTKSLLLQRVLSSNTDDRMPPPETGKSLTKDQQDLLVRWVTEGANWEDHWAFVPPMKPSIPKVRAESWPRNPIDRFVLARLEHEGLTPSPEADRYTLIRRVSQDLTGLPPSPEEIHRFVSDPDPAAYDSLVDRLLASPRYGEHMARYWLDLARYADTNGHAADVERTMWRYRDWVINAFNANMPFDQFTIEQLAGDLLPNPTLDQRIATGFNRNHPIMGEGGSIFEEYRVGYVVDRVDTTASTWLGLSMKCAQCHDHKYDPISQREFYEFYSYFNNVTEEESRLFGTELDGNSVPTIKAPLPSQQAELDRLDLALKQVRAEMHRPLGKVDESQRNWEVTERAAVTDQWSAVNTEVLSASTMADQKLDTITIQGDTTLSSISALRIEIIPLVKLNELDPDCSLTEVSLFISQGDGNNDETQIKFANAESLNIDPDNLIKNKPVLLWDEKSETDSFRALLAAKESFGFTNHTRLRLVLRGEGLVRLADSVRISLSNDASFLPARMGPWYINGPFVSSDGDQALANQHVDPLNIDLSSTYDDGRVKWVRPPGGLGDGKSHRLSGKMCSTYFHRTITTTTPRSMSISLDNRNAVQMWVNGRLVFDKEAQRGEVAAHPSPATIFLREGENSVLIKTVDYYDFNQHTFFFQRTGEEVGQWPLLVEEALLRNSIDRTEVQAVALRSYYRSRHWEGWAALLERQQDLEWERHLVEKEIPTTMVMEELEEPRPAHILVRGEYDQPADPVSPGVPAALHSWPEQAPQNRLGLAQWLVDRKNPLTARVTVNRIWQQYFGSGIVRTPDDFGIQGSPPSHPRLLDWLAIEFVDNGWDLKALQRLIVTSATYRQSSRISPELSEVDPQNTLLARGPRYRLEAEQIRDNALVISGLLVETLGGPSVKPYQPPGIWRDVAYGGGGQRYTAQEFVQDHDDALYRRSLYTFWKRAAAPPNMLLFDAPNRDVCTAWRGQSNTPLQSLVLMNDVQYVEAARAVAFRILNESGPGIEERIAFASLLVLARPARPTEENVLRELFEAQYRDYRSDPEAALALLKTGESTFEESADPAEHAAWTMVACALMNTDSAISQF